MTERKFTDEEVIKALECCVKEQCENCCNLANWHEQWNCMTDIMKQALDLIKRQRAEIEKWQLAYDCADSALRELSVTRSEAIKEFAERLKASFPDKNDPHFTADDAFTLNYIDYLVEELTEGKEGMK